MNSVREFKENVSSKLSLLRSIQRLISSEQFQEIYPLFTLEEKEQIAKLVESLNKIAIENLIAKKIREQNNYEEMSLRELRELAKYKFIPYWLYNKGQLIREIKQHEEAISYSNSQDDPKMCFRSSETRTDECSC